MELKELKHLIELKAVPQELIIFVCSENTFLADQYIDAICDINNLVRRNIASLSEMNSSMSLVSDFSSDLNVLTVDTFAEAIPDIESLTNVIIICNKIDKDIKKVVKNYIVEMPKLLDWQVKDYMKLINSNLIQDDINWLYNAAKGNIYRILNELDKLALFEPKEQKLILEEIKYEPNTDLFALDYFALIEAILTKNKQLLFELIKHKNAPSINFFSLVYQTLSKAKQIILITQQSGINADDLGMSSKQFNYMKYNSNHYSVPHLKHLIDVLSKLDLQVKSGLLDISDQAKIDYLVTNIF